MLVSLFTVALAYLFPWIPAWAVFIPAVLEGAVLTPALVFAGLGRGLWSKLHYWYGAIIAGRVAYYQRSDGAEFAPVSEDGTMHLKDGRTPQLEMDETKWYRLGNRPLAFTWDKSDPVLVERFADLESIDIMTTAGEIGVLRDSQAGVYGYTPEPRVASEDQDVGTVNPTASADGGTPAEGPYLVSGDKVAKRMHGGDDTGLAESALNKAIKDHAGDTSMSERMMLIAGVVALLGGAATGLLYVGLIA